jgi:hypothetical protein
MAENRKISIVADDRETKSRVVQFLKNRAKNSMGRA